MPIKKNWAITLMFKDVDVIDMQRYFSVIAPVLNIRQTPSHPSMLFEERLLFFVGQFFYFNTRSTIPSDVVQVIPRFACPDSSRIV